MPELIKVFMRHAKSVNNERLERGIASEDRVGGYQPKVELSPLGWEQARKLGSTILPSLREMLGHEFTVVRFSTAPARRTYMTAVLAYTAMDLEVPLQVDSRLHELRKGNKWLGGDEKRLRRRVETPRYHDRRARQGWDFRHGRPLINSLGLGILNGAETAREAGSRIVEWLEEVPDVSQKDSGMPMVDMAVGHGLAGRYGIAMALHRDPEHTADIGIGVQEADICYRLPNASAFVLSQTEEGAWVERGRITLPESW
jgi:broad specificity phosphatase PhoE